MQQFPEHVYTKTSTIADGNMSFRFGDREEVLNNRRRFLKENGADYSNCVCMACDHGEQLIPIDWNTDKTHFGATAPEHTIKAEVLVTKEIDLSLMLLTADCIPAVFYDPVTEVIALAHLSRKTIAYELVQKTVGFLHTQFNSNPADLRVHFGPHIKKDSYQFKLPLIEPTPAPLAPYIEIHNGVASIDMTGAEIVALTDAGVKRAHITVSDIDTARSPAHFSHYRTRRDSTVPEGRLATVAMIRPYSFSNETTRN